MDFTGGLLATLALFLIAFGITGTSTGSDVQTSSAALPFIGAGGVALVTFVAWEARTPQPLVPLTLFASKGFSGANAVTFLNDFAVSANLFFLPMAAIAGWGETAASVSVLFLPLPILLTVLSEPCGRLADRFGPAPLVVVGSLLVAAACAGLAMSAPSHELWAKTVPLMSLMALGQGVLVSPLSTAAMTSEDDEKAIVGSSINNAISRTAWLLSVAAMGGVAAIVFAMSVAGTPADTAGVSFGLPPAATLSPLADTARIAASDAAYAAIAAVTAALVGLSAAIAAATLKWKVGVSTDG